MKKTLITTGILIAIITILTTCQKWYDNMDSFETVLTSGVWQLVEYYQQPNPETPENKNSIHNYFKEDIFKECTYVDVYYTNNELYNYVKPHRSTEKFVINKITKDTLYAGISTDYSPYYWYTKNNKLKQWKNKIVGESTNETDTTIYIIKQYSDKFIELYFEKEFYIEDLDAWQFGDTIIPVKDTVIIKTFMKYKNVKDDYIIP